MEINNIKVKWLKAFNQLLKLGKYRFKVYYGGRGGAKTVHIAIALLALGQRYKMRILCTREVQNSITDSVHQTLSDLIAQYELTEYRIQNNTIVNTYTGAEFIFKGLRKETANSLKSLANIDICWVEEAHGVSQRSWDILIPTIRNKNSEIWISFNPEFDDDPAYKMFIEKPTKDVYVKKVGWQDNKYLPNVLLKEKDKLYKLNPKKARHVWGGECLSNFDANIFHFDENVNCVENVIKYDKTAVMWTGWDFGTADGTAIIFAQFFEVPKSKEFPLGMMINIVDECYEVDKKFSYYREIVDNKPYTIQEYACDPSGKNRESNLKGWIDNLAVNPKTKKKDWHFKYSNYYAGKVVEMVDRTNDYVHAIRYNKHTCPTFHSMMRKWQWRTDKNGKLILPLKALHNEFSHIGTALYFLMINRFPTKKNEVFLP